MGLQIKVETVNGIYTVNKPIGRMGAKHMALLSKCAPTKSKVVGDEDLISPQDLERSSQVFEEWAEKILPHLLVDGPFKTIEEMPGEDQYAIFIAMMMSMGGKDKEFFRIIE